MNLKTGQPCHSKTHMCKVFECACWTFSKLINYMIDVIWYEIIDEFPNVTLEKHVIMPNHFHCIIGIDSQNRNPYTA